MTNCGLPRFACARAARHVCASAPGYRPFRAARAFAADPQFITVRRVRGLAPWSGYSLRPIAHDGVVMASPLCP